MDDREIVCNGGGELIGELGGGGTTLARGDVTKGGGGGTALANEFVAGAPAPVNQFAGGIGSVFAGGETIPLDTPLLAFGR